LISDANFYFRPKFRFSTKIFIFHRKFAIRTIYLFLPEYFINLVTQNHAVSNRLGIFLVYLFLSKPEIFRYLSSTSFLLKTNVEFKVIKMVIRYSLFFNQIVIIKHHNYFFRRSRQFSINKFTLLRTYNQTGQKAVVLKRVQKCSSKQNFLKDFRQQFKS